MDNLEKFSDVSKKCVRLEIKVLHYVFPAIENWRKAIFTLSCNKYQVVVLYFCELTISDM